MEFVHLHTHSHYSFLDGACRIDDLVNAAVDFGMTSLAITDHGNLFGAFEFYNKAREAGIKPILGIEAFISPTHRTDRSMGRIDSAAYHILLLAMNNTGWRNLIKLSSRAYLEGFYYRPRIDRELLSQHNEGVVCGSACLGGEIPSAFLKGDPDRAREVATAYRDIFGPDRFFIEVQDQGYPEQQDVNPMLVQLAQDIGVKIVGTNDAHFLSRDHKSTHEVLTCISTGKVLSEDQRMRYSPDLYFKSQAEMKAVLSPWPDAFENTTRIADMCECELDFSEQRLPSVTTPGGKSPDEHLEELSRKGLRDKFGGKEPPPGHIERLNWELQVIKDKGYSSYFLIIHDCVKFARDNGIPIAPRGSGVATLIGYALEFDNVDPLKYGLLFERFTDPQREENPDIDLDICQEGRADVLKYVREKYGHVAQIITYGTLKARAAVRDVGRVMDVPLDKVDVIAKAIPEGPKVTLQDALDEKGDLRKMYDSDPVVRELVDHGRNLEGLVRHSGIHAAGVVLYDKPLDDFLPLCSQAGSSDVITQWDGPTCEAVGMMKMDFLGLRTLTIIQRARKLVKEQTGVDIDPEELPLDDPEVFSIFQSGHTDGVFQFESEGMQGVLTQMKPTRIEDLIAANAMYRPGPMKLIGSYCARKNGKEEVPGIHELVDDILAETYGIMVYQEQVMLVLNKLGKLPLNRALTLIKAISKKKETVIESERANFMSGAHENGISEAESKRLFDLILEFAGYGFNKAHSTRYAILAYQTAYFKVHHPCEFIAATLTYECSDRDKVVQYINAAEAMGVNVAPPDINLCDSDFTVDNGRVRFGLSAVKGVGAKAVEEIVRARATEGPFTDMYHFCDSIDLRVVNRSTTEALIKCGAFDSLEDMDRAAMLACLDPAIQSAQSSADDKRRGQISLFDDDTVEIHRPPPPSVEPWSPQEILAAEKELLGFYVTSHPLEQYRSVTMMLNWPVRFTLDRLDECATDSRVGCGCIIAQHKVVMGKRGRGAGKKMAMVTLEDLRGRCDAVLFSETYDRCSEFAVPDAMVYVLGTVSRRNDRVNIVVNDMYPIEQAVEKATGAIRLRFRGSAIEDPVLKELKSLLTNHSGNCPVSLEVRPLKTDGCRVTISTGRQWSISPSRDLLDSLEELVGKGNLVMLPKRLRSKQGTRARYRKHAAQA